VDDGPLTDEPKAVLIGLDAFKGKGTGSVVTATIPVGATPVGVAVNPLTSTVYVTNFRGKTVSVISG